MQRIASKLNFFFIQFTVYLGENNSRILGAIDTCKIYLPHRPFHHMQTGYQQQILWVYLLAVKYAKSFYYASSITHF